MLRPHGFITIADASGPIVERDSITCGHCGLVVKVKPGTFATTYLIDSLHVDPVTRVATIITKEEPGAACRVCMKAVCLKCEKAGFCTPLMKRIEQMEAKGRQLTSILG